MTTWICELCGTTASRRGTKPGRFCSRACSDKWLARDIPDAATLRAWYWDEGLTANEIALKVDRNPKRIWEWLKAAGIETRSRGSYGYAKGKPSPFRGKTHSAESRASMRAGRAKVPREAYAGNGHYLRERKGIEHPNWKGGVTPERQAFYVSTEWKAAARAVWIRDKCTCQRCGCNPPRSGPKHNRGHIHHIVSFQVAELRTELTNLVLLCADCHRWVHSRANTEKDYIG